jgi:phospholipase/lecithinase/hemolysin
MALNHLRQLLLIVPLLLASLFGTNLAAASEYPRVVAFGDSLSDPGNAFVLTMNVSLPPFQLIPDAPYARGGMHFSNGKTWVEQLADDLDVPRSAGPALRGPVVFSNYAVGGARARPEGVFDLTTQVDLFLRDFSGAAPADALYVVYAGSNDVRDGLAALASDPSGATSSAILQGALAALRDNLLRLQAAGARHFLVPNAPDLSLVPAVRLQGAAVQGAARALATSYNTSLTGLLNGLEAASGLPVTRLDIFALLDEVVAAPGKFGLSNVEQACIVPGTTVQPYCVRPDQYLFWDGIHPTRMGHAIVAGRAMAALGIELHSLQQAAAR